MSKNNQDDVLRDLFSQRLPMATDEQTDALDPAAQRLVDQLNSVDVHTIPDPFPGITALDVFEAMAELDLTWDEVLRNRSMIF